METTNLNQLVADHRRARETDAREHRLTKDIAEPVPHEPRLRSARRRRPLPQRQTLAEG